MAVPTTDAGLAQWSVQFQEVGTATPADFGLTAAQMVTYTGLHDLYIAAYNASKAVGQRSKTLTDAKNSAKANLLVNARELYGFIQSNNSVTPENKTLIGVLNRDFEPSPVPPPAMSPILTVLSVTGRMVRGALKDRQFPDTKRRPLNAAGATIFSYYGATPPPHGDAGWKPEGQTGETKFVVEFSNDVPPGTPCWLIAVWYNRRGEWSPACDPVKLFLQIGAAA